MAAYLIALHMGLHASNKGSEPESLLSVLESVQPVHLLLEMQEECDRQSRAERSAQPPVGFPVNARNPAFARCVSPGRAPRCGNAYEDARRSTGKIGASVHGHSGRPTRHSSSFPRIGFAERVFRSDGVEKKERAGRESREAKANRRKGRMAQCICRFPICGFGWSGAFPYSLTPYRRPVRLLPARGDSRNGSQESSIGVAAVPRAHTAGSQT